MKLFPALTGTLLLGVAASVAQNSPAPIRWAEGAPNATSEVKNDAKIEGLKTDDVHIFVSLSDLKETEYNRVWVQVSNQGKTAIDIDPQSAMLVNVKDKTVRAEAADKTAHSIQKFGEAKSQELSSAHCPNMIATGCQPTNSQMQMSKQVAAYSNQQAQWVKDNALEHKSIAAGEEAKGYIFFKKDKKKSDYVLRIPVGTEVFEFPFTADNKVPSYD